MKKTLTIEEGNTDCNKCPLEKICTSNCDVALNLFEVDCQLHNLNTLKIEEENKSIDWEQSKAFIALMQLIRLRDYYNEHSENTPIKYAIVFNRNKIRGCKLNIGENRVLMFNSENLANKFLNNFRNLIEQAKYLI